MFSAFIMSVVMLDVVMLDVGMLNVAAPGIDQIPWLDPVKHI
jgi:hypothetical protein